jgi:peptidoglycan/xylan/chitin deacetylase (PgdA/CDA1 family)
MRGKREWVAAICESTGVTGLLERLPSRRLLVVLNYHRIGNAYETPYDSGTFSCTAPEFDWQIGYLSNHYKMTALEESLEMLEGSVALTEPTFLITFDDGYIDNYRIAFPILRRHGVQAVFFAPTSFVGTGKLPWWDAIAYIVKRSSKTRISLNYPEPRTFDLVQEGVNRCIMHILALYTQPAMQNHDRFVDELERICDSSRPLGDAERCFLSWDEAREIQEAGMAFGSHTHRHEILSKLSKESQTEELFVSREILQHELGRKIDTLAYPVGARHTFSAETVEALRQTQYRAAFSFYGGFNKPGTTRAFDICRCAVAGQSRARLRLQTALGTSTGRGWF